MIQDRLYPKGGAMEIKNAAAPLHFFEPQADFLRGPYLGQRNASIDWIRHEKSYPIYSSKFPPY